MITAMQVETYIPARVREAAAGKTKPQWAKDLFEAHRGIGKGKSDIEASCDATSNID